MRSCPVHPMSPSATTSFTGKHSNGSTINSPRIKTQTTDGCKRNFETSDYLSLPLDPEHYGNDIHVDIVATFRIWRTREMASSRRNFSLAFLGRLCGAAFFLEPQRSSGVTGVAAASTRPPPTFTIGVVTWPSLPASVAVPSSFSSLSPMLM